MSYKDVHSGFPAEAMPEMPAGFVDRSWTNDAAPTFCNDELRLMIVVQYPDPRNRWPPFYGPKRFHVFPTDALDAALLATDDWSEVLALVASLAAARSTPAASAPP